MKKLEWSDVDKYLDDYGRLNTLWVSEAVRTEDFDTNAVSKCQLMSKFRLIDLVEQDLGDVLLCGAWYGQLAIMLHDAKLGSSYTGVDIDRSTQVIAEHLNRRIPYEHVIDDMYLFGYSGYDTVINTSCEHIGDLKAWLTLVPDSTLVILQSNNYDELEEHINCSHSIEEFQSKADLTVTYVADTLSLPMYDRYTIIGRV